MTIWMISAVLLIPQDSVPPETTAKMPPWLVLVPEMMPIEGLRSETVLQEKPTHSPLVTRWLKVYIYYDVKTREVVRMIVTIRGELRE
jgi:hypothetical protein